MTEFGLVTKLVFMLFALSFSLQAQPTKNLKPSGSIRFILEESFEGKFDNGSYNKIGKDRQISWMNDNKMEFDKNGNMIKRSFYNDSREFIHAEEYEFNNQQLKKKKYLSFSYTYNHDSRGNVLEEMVAPVTDSTQKKIKHRFAYDNNNRLTELWEYDFQGGEIYHQRNTYNANGQKSKEFYAYADGNEFKLFYYDIKGNIEKIEWFDESVGLLERTTYFYENGKLTAELWEVFEKNKLETSTKFEFDEFGNPISVLEVNPKRQIHDHEINNYVFDDKGNWIRKLTAINDSRYYIVERRIAYY